MTSRDTVLYAAKGGQGCTVTTTVLAMLAAETEHVVLADPSGDCRRVLGRRFDADIRASERLMVSWSEPLYRPWDSAPCFIDAGTDYDVVRKASHARRILVTRGDYVALSRTHLLPLAPDGFIFIEEAGRALRVEDAAAVIGAPLLATIPLDPAVTRCVDAGLLDTRMPRSLARLRLKVTA